MEIIEFHKGQAAVVSKDGEPFLGGVDSLVCAAIFSSPAALKQAGRTNYVVRPSQPRHRNLGWGGGEGLCSASSRPSLSAHQEDNLRGGSPSPPGPGWA